MKTPASEEMRIGTAASELGVEAHVLRHWEDVGVLIPRRAPGGQRLYDADLLARGAIIRMCQRAGMSLAEIVELFGARPIHRQAALIARKQAELQATVDDLRKTIDFLDHVISCRHPIIDQCPECATFSRNGLATRAAPTRVPRRTKSRQPSRASENA